MLKCRDVSELSSDYLDGQLPLRKRVQIRFHLFMCTHCRRYLRHFQSTITLIKKLKKTKANQQQVESVMGRIQKEKSKPSK